MYNPIQIPYVLDQTFLNHVSYTESPADELGGFALCFWEMKPLTDKPLDVENIVVADGCIDLVVNYESGDIGFSGMSRTEFHFAVRMPAYYCGFRLMPGAFHQLTGLPASAAMDTFISLAAVFEDFEQERFFALCREQGQAYLRSWLADKVRGRKPDLMTTLFHQLYEHPPASTKELYQLLHLSPRQCQRNFTRHYGFTPKMALSIIRFQQCLRLLISPQARPEDVRSIDSYYDQPHFIKDFKRYIGITPLELIRHYDKGVKHDAFLQ